MERRLVEAFDRITMPEETARRIEDRLNSQQISPQRYTMVLDRRQSRPWWKWALAASCAVLLLLLPLFHIPEVAEEAVPEYIAPTDTEETVVIQEGLPFWEEGRAILDPLCQNMPDWKGYASLEDSFWTEFVVRTLNGYTEEGFGMLQTQAGSASLVDGRIRMDENILSAYVEKIMGIPLPVFSPCGPYADMLSHEGGAYYASNTVFSNLSYTLKDSRDGDYPEVTYSIHPAPGGEELGTVTFLLSRGKGEGEYVVLDKTTSGRRISQEAPEMEAAAMEYAKAYFANDVEEIVSFMTSRSDWTLVLSPMVRNMYTGEYPGGWDQIDYRIEEITPYGFPWDNSPPVVYVNYSWQEKDYAGTYSLVLYMAKTGEGWKVRFSDEDTVDSYDPELPIIRTVATSFGYDYAMGDVKRVKQYMASDAYDPPVHECTTRKERYENGGNIIGADATVYYDQDTPDPVTGELHAEVWLEFSTTDPDLDGQVLILNMVKKTDGWKVEAVSEG